MLISCCLFPRLANADIAPTNSAAITGSVSDSGGKPVANATVSLSGPKRASTHTDVHGLFVLVGLPFGTYQVTVDASGLGSMTRSVDVEGDTNVAIAYNAAMVNGMKVIANTSTSAETAAFNVTPASMTQVNPMDLAFAGQTSWRKVLEEIPGVSQAGLAGGGKWPYTAFPDSPMMPVQLSINGSLPNQNATLLDGMPLIGGGLSWSFSAISGSGQGAATGQGAGQGTDIGVYPMDGFSSADVVRGPGADSPSIVGSVGGSFVLHMASGVSHNYAAFSSSTDAYGGIVTHATTGLRWKKLSAVITYGVTDSPGPSSSGGFNPTLGREIGTVNGHAFICDSSCYMGLIYNHNYYPYYFQNAGYNTGLTACCQNENNTWGTHGGSIALTYNVSPSVTAQISFAGQNAISNLQTYKFQANFSPPSGYTGNMPAGTYFLNTLGGDWDFGNYQNSSSLLEEKITARLGQGILQLGAVQNTTFSSYTSSQPHTLTAQLFGGGVLCSDTSPNCNTGTYVPTTFNGGTSYTIGIANGSITDYYDKFHNYNRDLRGSYDTQLGNKAHAGISFVKSYFASREDKLGESYDPTTGLENVYTSQYGNADASQTTEETRLWVGGNPSPKTSLDLSMYFSRVDYHTGDPYHIVPWVDVLLHYATPRLGFVWRPTPTVSIRASAGGGFAPAAPGDLVGTSLSPSPCGIAGGPPNSAYCVTLTQLNLQPEKSFAVNLGTDIRVNQNTIFSFDVYRTNLYGEIYYDTSIRGTYTGVYGTLPLLVTQFGNLAHTRMEGINVSLQHGAAHGFTWVLAGALTRGYIVDLPGDFYNNGTAVCDRTTGANCINLTVVPGINYNGLFTASIPYASAHGTLGYRFRPGREVDLTATYWGNNNTYYEPAFVTLDGNVAYALTKNVSLLMNFRNITGIYDNSVQHFGYNSFIGEPTIAGGPRGVYRQAFGPRTMIMTMQVHL